MYRLLPFLLCLSLFSFGFDPEAGAQLRADFSVDHAGGCTPLVVHFAPFVTGGSVLSGAVYTYNWDLGNGNSATISTPEAVYSTVGTYTVTLTVSYAGRTASATHTVTVYPAPSVSFTAGPAVVCGAPVEFTGNTDGSGSAGSTGSGGSGGSSGGSGSGGSGGSGGSNGSGGSGGSNGSGGGGGSSTIVSWLWDFGDGTTTTSYGPTTSHLYPPSSPIGASLTVTDNHGCTATLSQAGFAQVYPPLNAGFSADKSVLCTVADPVQFTNTSNGPGTLSFSWDFGDGTNSTTTSPSHVYPSAGSYNVRLSVTSSVGCTASFLQPTAMNVANYTTDFSVSRTTVCANSIFDVTDISTPQPTSRMWQMDGVTVGSYYTLSQSFAIAGTHTITLANTYGTCPQQVTKTVTVNASPPVVPFSWSPQLNCADYSVTVTDQSTTDYTRTWDPNYTYDALPSAFVPGNATMTFPGYGYSGTHTIALQLTNSYGCSTLITQLVSEYKSTPTIYEPNPGPIGTCSQPITKSFAINYGGTLQSYYWDFGDGTTSTSPNPTHTWSQPGGYGVTLHYVDANGCSGTTNPLPTIISSPFSLSFSGTPTTVCAGSSVNFSSNLNTVGASNYSWDFGDGTGLSATSYHTYYTPGIYSVTLSATNTGGCSASTTQTHYITVVAPPGRYDGHTNTCDHRNVVTFAYANTNATSLSWDFGDGQTAVTDGSVTQQQHTYPKTGTYYINLSVSNGTCTAQNSDVVNVLTNQTPVLSATTNTACANGSLNVQLAIARNPAEINSGYFYDYTPQFFYADGKPFSGFVSFTNGSQPYANGAFGWTLSGFEPGESGLYVVTTSFGFNCTDQSNTIPLSIKGSATPALTIISNDHCYQQPVVLQDASTVGAGNSILSGLWDFGDGQTQALVLGGQASHTYSSPGSYTVRLTINDAGGCQTTSGAGVGGVDVYGPKAAFNPSATTLLFGSTLYLYNTTNTFDASTVTYTWDFGDGGTSSMMSPSHLYAAPGTYTVTLSAAGPLGCSSAARATIVVQPYNSHFQTHTNYVTNGKCPPVLAQFTNTSYGYSRIAWDFGDGTTAGNVSYPSHVYASPGTYTVTLSCYNGPVLQAQYTDVVNVRQPSAVVAAVTPAVCLGSSAFLQATARGAASYLFDFGDGTVGDGGDAAVGHVYKQAGNYDVALVVTDTVGCAEAATAPVPVVVNALPVLAVTPLSPVACLNASVQLSASGASIYSWSPATGLDQPNATSPVASPLETTFYTVVGVDHNGCTGTDTVTVKIVPPQHVSVSPDSTVLCFGDTVSFQAKGTDVYNWIGDTSGLSSVVSPVPSARPPASMHYTVVGSDAFECFHDTGVVVVTVLPVPTVDGGPDVEVLAGTPVSLLATGSNDIVSWQWSPPDYLSCTDCEQPVCTPKKPSTYTVKAINDVGCSAHDTVQVKLLCVEARVRIPQAFTPNGDGRNDRFDILGIGEVEHLVIFDRWGEKVFERNHFYTADPGSQWDGTIHGQPAPTGTYVYFAEMTCPSGGAFSRKGTVVLIR